MKKNFWLACLSSIAFFATLPAHAIVMFSADYVVGLNNGNTGVSTGDTVHISAFYDPLFAELTYQDQYSVVHTFDAEHGGLSFTVGDQVWRTTGPLTLHTYYYEDELDRPKHVGVEFLANTRLFTPGQVASALETPWSADVTGQQALYFLPEFTARAGLDPAEVLVPRLFTEEDFASLLDWNPKEFLAAAFADTSAGSVFFNARDPGYAQPPPAGSVPEPGMLALFGIGLIGIALNRKRRSRAPVAV